MHTTCILNFMALDVSAMQQGIPLMQQYVRVQSHSLKEVEQSGVLSICCIVYSILYHVSMK